MRLTKTGRLVAVVSKRTIHVFTRSRSKAGLGCRHATSMQAGAAARVSRETGAERVGVLYFTTLVARPRASRSRRCAGAGICLCTPEPANLAWTWQSW